MSGSEFDLDEEERGLIYEYMLDAGRNGHRANNLLTFFLIAQIE